MSSQFVVSNGLTLRVEDKLILLCSRVNADAETSARIEGITNPANEVDWDYFYQLARRHSVLPLIYKQLSSIPAAKVPADQLARLKANYQKNLVRNLLLTAELCSILQTFAAAGIEAVPYKGPALAVYAYGKLELRRFVDLDILVRKADVLRAKELLTARGFVCGPPWTDAQQALLLHTQHNLSLSREDGLLVVELHWEVASRLFAASLQAEEFWGRLKTMRLNNVTVKSLSAEDLLLSLCVHGSKHLWERLAWVCDVAELIKTRTDLNWSVLLKRAASTKNDRMLFLGLYLANRLLDAPLPGHVKSKIEAKVIVSLANKVAKRLFGGISQPPVSIGQSFKFNWAVRAGWRARLRYCRLLFQPTDADIETVPLPRPLRFVYYLMRPLGLLRRDRERRLIVASDHRKNEG
jgi:Uncharacterised nucleotidyltransferase